MHCCGMSLAWDLMDLRIEGSGAVSSKRRCFVFLFYFNRDVCEFVTIPTDRKLEYVRFGAGTQKISTGGIFDPYSKCSAGLA